MNKKLTALFAIFLASSFSLITAHAAVNVDKSIYFKTVNSCTDHNRYVEFIVQTLEGKLKYNSGTTFQNPGEIQYNLPIGQYHVMAIEMAGNSGVGIDCLNESTGEDLSTIDLKNHQAASITVTWDQSKAVPDQASCRWNYIN